jgi:hypothetical protein
MQGMSQYPELEKRYREQLDDARRTRTGCPRCAVNKVHERFRQLLSDRLKRDKMLQKR